MLDNLHFSDRPSEWLTSGLRAIDKAGLLHFFKFFLLCFLPLWISG